MSNSSPYSSTVSSISAIISFVIIVFLAAVVGFFLMQQQHETAQISNDISGLNSRVDALQEKFGKADQDSAQKSFQLPQSSDSPFVDYETTYFRDDATGVDFYYPKSWGIIHASDEYGEAAQNGVAGVAARSFDFTLAHVTKINTFSQSSNTFLTIDNVLFEPLGRGGYWGDASAKISSLDDVKNFCANKKECSTFVNKKGTLIAKLTDKSCHEGGCSAFSTSFYYAFNPFAPWRGVALSAAHLLDANSYDKLDWKQSDLERQVDDVAQSLEFVR